MPTHAYNLLDEPWIPVRWRPDAPRPADGELPDRIGLREVLERSADITGLAVPVPPAHSALLRILYALTARVTGLDEAGPGDWGERRQQSLEDGHLPPRGVDSYLARYRDRFFLYAPDGGRPWMQDPRLAAQCDAGNTAGVNKLIVTRPAGNNHAWFRHGSDTAPDLPTAPEAVLNLLVWHYYGPSGRCSAREVNGAKTASATAGPLRTALSYHPEGNTLLETLLAGLTPPETTVRRTEDRCPWEWDDLPDPDAAPPVPSGPCSRLTACSQHAVLLVPDERDPGLVREAFITWAYRTGRIPRDDNYLIWQISQQGNRYPRPADSRRALWRDLDALLMNHPAGASQPQQPKVFDTAYEVSEDLRVRALGFEQEGQAKDTQFVDGSTPPVLGYIEDLAPRTAPAVARMRQLGEMYGYRLERAVRRAWTTYMDDAKADAETWEAEAGARYWPQAEAEFWARFRALDRTGQSLDVGFDPAATRAAFLRLAEQAFDAVTASVTRTLRGAKAVSTARLELYGGRRKKKKTP
ncbi:type I-E CRISPR-associated protein Cse1/CasA [Streptomyces chitinivorans]|uniref:Type I-E CRISPR-associated protein Cse1/CasA n=1 Tax=Streptomyces chitinivorans TaxID=1257027 RepID=A0ABW7HNT6_9ACTN|nr:type I-E CRISPR-associated protein Cse1/CasA [Streptomyces chitinivorans]MDH2411791.1 type I-E CRISPR-associated protein Cse1/CasA [Streptomyces chitinivorans]